MARRLRPAEDFRICNYWAWHIKAERDESMIEARRSLAWRTQMVPPFHGLDLLLDEPDLQFVKDHFDDFVRASRTRSGRIDNVPEALVNYLVSAVCSAGDYGDIERELDRYRALEKAGFTDLALKIFDGPMDAVKTICARVVPALA